MYNYFAEEKRKKEQQIKRIEEKKAERIKEKRQSIFVLIQNMIILSWLRIMKTGLKNSFSR